MFHRQPRQIPRQNDQRLKLILLRSVLRRQIRLLRFHLLYLLEWQVHALGYR